MVEYFVFRKKDITIFYSELTDLMCEILASNISQGYPDNTPKDYVIKMSDYIEDGSAFVVGAKDNCTLVGFSWAYSLKIFDEPRFHINMIGVNAGYRKRGIAQHLVEMQMNEAKKRGVRVIEAMTTRSNKNSYNWFHSLGFEDERVKVKLEL